MELALQLVDRLAADFAPQKYRDTYRDVLRAAIKQKVEGRALAEPAPEKRPKVIDLMDALRKSLAESRKDLAPAGRSRAGQARAKRGRRRAAA
jgi:DNA end-binding protein Ku